MAGLKSKPKDEKKGTGYTKAAGGAAAKRNCKAGGGKWVNGKCEGGAL